MPTRCLASEVNVREQESSIMERYECEMVLEREGCHIVPPSPLYETG